MKEHKIRSKSAEAQIAKFGFTLAEVEQLGLTSLDKFKTMYGVNIMSFSIKDMKWLYSELMTNPAKYKSFAMWIKPRLDLFVLFEFPLRIYVGGDKQFIQRGDEKLEKSLKKLSRAIEDYIDFGYITPNRISTIMYYLNLMV